MIYSSLALYLIVALMPFTRLYIPALDLDVNIIAVADLSAIPGGGISWDLAAIGDQVGWLDPVGGPDQMGSGNVVLAGHYDIPPGGQSGAFYDLAKLDYGDFIYTMRLDGTTMGYRVTESRIVDDNDLTVLWDAGDSRLTLIGCLGTDYAHRRVVVAESLGMVVCAAPGGGRVPCF